MPSYHSILNHDINSIPISCGFPLISFELNKQPILDFKKIKEKSINVDILDEALTYYRLNILFKNYPLKSEADKIIVYATVFLSKCLEIFHSNYNDAKKTKDALKELIIEAEWSPNYKTHFLNGILINSSSNKNNVNSNSNSYSQSEVSSLQKYLKQIRTELVFRLNCILFDNENALNKNKFWLSYSKKKFLGYEMPMTNKLK